MLLSISNNKFTLQYDVTERWTLDVLNATGGRQARGSENRASLVIYTRDFVEICPQKGEGGFREPEDLLRTEKSRPLKLPTSIQYV